MIFAKDLTLVFRFIFICIAISSCNNHHESETDQIVRIEFKNNYLFILQNGQKKHSDLKKLEKLENTNPDAFRSIAYTWQNAAIETCRTTESANPQAKSLSSYEILLAKESSTLHSDFQTDESIRYCVYKYYAANWEKINAMISFNEKLN